MLQARDLVKRYGKRVVLDRLTFELQPGATTVLLGANGAGKSTFLRLALGALRRDGGELRVLGSDPQRRAPREVGYVPDRPDAYPWMTARDLFRFLAPHYRAWDDARAEAAAASLGAPLDRSFARMSRGEGMKVMLAAALAPSPRLLLLDEPFGGLDPLVREDVLRGVVGELSGQTVLCATHDLDVAARIADRVAVLAHGRIVREGPVDEVLGEGRAPERMRAALAEAQA